MELRPATVADGPAIADVRLALGPRHDDSGAAAGYRRHLMAEGRLWVALDAGRVVAFAGTRDIGGGRMLSDLFVHPDRQGSGIGGRLLDVVMTGAPAGFTFASDDPRALPLYVRAGMSPVWPLLDVRGEVADLVAARPASSRTRSAACVVGPRQAAAVEAVLTGADRSVEHRYWAGRPGAVAMVAGAGSTVAGGPSLVGGEVRNGDVARTEHLGVRNDRIPLGGAVMERDISGVEQWAAASDPSWVGVAVRTGDAARVEHLAVADDTDPCEAFDALLAALGVSRYEAHVPGPSPLLRHLLDRLGRIVDLDHHMAGHPGLVPAQLHVVHPGLC